MLETTVIALVGLALMLMVVLTFPTMFDIAWRLMKGQGPNDIVKEIVEETMANRDQEDDINGGEYLAQDDEDDGLPLMGAGSTAQRMIRERGPGSSLIIGPLFERVERYVMSSKSDVAVNGPVAVVLSPPMPFLIRSLFIAPAQELKIAPGWVLFLLRLFSWFRIPWLYREMWEEDEPEPGFKPRWYIAIRRPTSALYHRLHSKAQARALENVWVEGIEVNHTELLAGPRMHANIFSAMQVGQMFSGPVCQAGFGIKVKLNGTGGHVFVTVIGEAKRVA